MKQPARFALALCLFLALAACTGSTATPAVPSATPLPVLTSQSLTSTQAHLPAPLTPIAVEISPTVIPLTPSPENTATSSPRYFTLTPAVEITPVTPAPIQAFTSGCHSYYQSVPPGEYILYETDTAFFLISPDGLSKLKLVEGQDCIPQSGWTISEISRDGKFLAFAQNDDPLKENDGTELFVYDLFKDKLITKIQIDGECFRLSWAPDNRQMVLDCFTGQSTDLFVISIDGQQPIWLTTWEKEWHSGHAVENPQWSPDGRWISFQFDDKSESTRPRGYYVIDTACLLSPNTCLQKTSHIPFYPIGFWGPNNYAWSSDGQYISQGDDNDGKSDSSVRIALWDIEQKQEKVLDYGKGIGTDAVYKSLAWSPDNQWIAVNWWSDDLKVPGFRILSVTGKEMTTIQLPNENFGEIRDWLTILPPFAPGLELSVSLAGHDLNLRAEPLLGGAVLRKLAPGTRLTILEGPVEADGYTWWKMQTADGSEGWAVEVGVWYQPVSGE